MLRHLTALVLLPAMALAGVTFETDPRPVNRAAPGSSYADMLARITPAVVSVRTAEVIPQSVLKRYSGRIDPDKVMQDEQTGEVQAAMLAAPDGALELRARVAQARRSRAACCSTCACRA